MAVNAETSGKRLNAAERRKVVWDLRVGGGSLRKIAETVGVTAQQVHRDLRRAYAEHEALTAETVREHVMLDLARCERLMLAMMPAVQKGSPEACRTAVRILERKAKLLGLDAPERHEFTGRDGGPIQSQAVIALAALTDEQLLARMRQFESALALPPGSPAAAGQVVADVPAPDPALAAYERVLAERRNGGNGNGSKA